MHYCDTGDFLSLDISPLALGGVAGFYLSCALFRAGVFGSLFLLGLPNFLFCVPLVDTG